jgi:hypothetical protein
MQCFIRRAAAVLLAITAATCFAQARFDFQRTATILPKTVVPSKVHLRLDLDPEHDRFDGSVAIDVDVRQTVRSIVLHANELEPRELALRTGDAVRPLKLVASDLPQTWRLQPRDGGDIAPGRHRLELSYRGRVQSSGQGLFVVKHMADGRPARMLATQLEPIDARRVLPCFDEPVFRTVFEVEVKAPAGLRVLSNAPLVATTSEPGGEVHRFAPTLPMQSYLLSVAVGHFDVLEDEVDGVPLRIFTAPGKRAQAAFAMQSTKQVLHWYAQYFGRPFAMPKLDQLAVPGVRNGAMEDWGMISYREDVLLHDPERSAPMHQQPVFNVIAHEIAHQWFGDLVSPASWSEIWLNEAFATWMEHKAAARFHPEWESRVRSREWIEHTMARDATAATRAIRSGPVTETDVFNVFDDITYQKGGAVLSMIEQWVGPERFRQGLGAYMHERGLQPATAGDLWDHIGRASGQPVAAVAAAWTDRPGLPVVDVSATCEAGQTKVTLHRSRFAALDPLPAVAWQVPARISRGGLVRTALIGDGATTVTFPGCEPLPVLANEGAAGYYRVDPAPPLRERLVQALPHLAPIDALALLGDSFALTVAGRQPLQAHLALLTALPLVSGDARAPLYLAAVSQWARLDETFAGTPASASLRRAEQALWVPELQRVGWAPQPGERTVVSQLRAALITRLARLGDAATLAAAGERCAAAIAGDTRALAASMRRPVLHACAIQASDAQFESMHAAMLATPSFEEQSLLLGAMAASPDPVRARRLLDEAASGRWPGTLGAQLIWPLADTPGLGPMVYEFTVAHWSAFAAMAGDMSSMWLLPAAAGWGADMALGAKMVRDQTRLVGAHGAATANQVMTEIRTRTRMREREAARGGTLDAGSGPG